MSGRTAVWLLSLLIAGCGPSPQTVHVFTADNIPPRLSQWNLLQSDGERLILGKDVIPYDLNTPLFSDYALKLRTVYMPEGSSAIYREGRALDFPVGTVISKTFYYAQVKYPVVRKSGVAVALNADGALNLSAYRLLETRLLIRYEGGWKPLPYIWNDAQTDALLEIAGGVQRLEIVAEDGSSQAFDYIIPDSNQCGGCHAPNHSDQEIAPIGPRVDQLNRTYRFQGGPRNQLSHWAELGKIESLPREASELPRRADWADSAGASVEQRARAYLDANCAHCHNPQGAADTSGLHLDMGAPDGRNLGICKPPVAAGRGSGNRLFDIYPGRPDDSILLYRMQHSDPAIAMPELGRSLNHVEGVALIRDWITELPGSC